MTRVSSGEKEGNAPTRDEASSDEEKNASSRSKTASHHPVPLPLRGGRHLPSPSSPKLGEDGTPAANFDSQSQSPEQHGPDHPPVDGDSTASTSSSLSKAKTILTAAPKLAKSVITNAPNTAVDQVQKARDHLRDVEVGLSPSNRADEQSKDAAEALDEEAAQPPEIVYGKDVALNMAGYHNAEATGDDSDEAGKTPDHGLSAPQPDRESSQPFPSSSSPPSTSHLPLLESKQPYVRGASAPPDLQVTIPNTGDLSTSPPDYTWEWGAFPTRSPARPTFKPLVKDDAAVNVGPSHLGQSVTTAEDVAEDDAAGDKPSSTSEDEGSSAFGQGGQLFPDRTERDMFWVNMEGKKFSFQLSLCDNDEGRRRRFDDLESARWFYDEKVEYARLLADPDVAGSEQLVMKWGDRFITRRDNSPLMTALLQWRHNMKPLPEHQPCPPLPSSVSDPEHTSRPTSPSLSPANGTMSVSEKRTSGTSWARWWSRSRTAEQQQEQQGPGASTAGGVLGVPGEIFVWEETDRVVVNDIDGTITKSDALGHMFNLIGRDWTHPGVAKLYTDITRSGYNMIRFHEDYLKGIKQNNYQLPEGPVIMSPDRLMASLHREVIMRKPEVFKMACLRDIQRLFGLQHKEPFYAGFGNRITDSLSYRSVNVPSARIFTIDSSGEVKMELLELAGYKSSYIHMTDLVDQIFPPVHKKWATEFTDFNYWRDPLPDVDLPDLDPPSLSPALSAVTDTSSTIINSTPTAAAAANSIARNGRKEVSPSPLVRSVVSDDRSTTLADSASESEEHHRHARRKLSFDRWRFVKYEGSDGEEDDEEDEEEDGDEEVDEE
ncbi:hypothetical protein FRC05_009147, partial [Tulasnella sp. 425]